MGHPSVAPSLGNVHLAVEELVDLHEQFVVILHLPWWCDPIRADVVLDEGVGPFVDLSRNHFAVMRHLDIPTLARRLIGTDEELEHLGRLRIVIGAIGGARAILRLLAAVAICHVRVRAEDFVLINALRLAEVGH